LVAKLLDGSPPLWELERIGNAGLRLLRAGTGDEAIRSDLRDRLLERGFNEAASI
jgi:hypothetical protein